MKILIVGGITNEIGNNKKQAKKEMSVLKNTMEVLGAELINQGHEIVVCSPFQDSADYYVLCGIAKNIKNLSSQMSIYYPDVKNVNKEVNNLLQKLKLKNLRKFPCKYVVHNKPENESLQHSWLLAQLTALDASAGIILIGGKSSGSLNLLLQLAVAKNKNVLPLSFLGGAAKSYLETNFWKLSDILTPNQMRVLDNPNNIKLIPKIYEQLFINNKLIQKSCFFISYARARPQEADYVESLLRRRGHIVYRDEQDFQPSADIPLEILRNIKRANVFIAIWCKEYACSPWCYDELEMALARHINNESELWIFCVDETRIVPKAARTLNYYQVDTREKLESKVLFLLENKSTS